MRTVMLSDREAIIADLIKLRDYIIGVDALSPLSASITQIVAAAVDELLRETTWLPIDSAPKDGTEVLGWDPRLGVRVVFAIGGADDWVEVSECRSVNPTHWQPLPAPPEVKK